jgi:hypothetical protein
MNNRFIKKTIIVLFTAGFLLTAINAHALPPFLGQASKFGAKNCMFCHLKPSGGEGWNDRGNWLKAEKTKRKAEKVDVEWLKDYPEAKSTTPLD